MWKETMRLPSRGPGKGQQFHVYPRWMRLPTGHSAWDRTVNQVSGQMDLPKEVCTESHWHFKLAGHLFVFCLDRMCLHEGLWITVITWNCQRSWSGQPRGRSGWIIVLYYFWRKAVLLLSRRYSNGNQVWPGEHSLGNYFKDQLSMNCNQESNCLYVNRQTSDWF